MEERICDHVDESLDSIQSKDDKEIVMKKSGENVSEL